MSGKMNSSLYLGCPLQAGARMTLHELPVAERVPINQLNVVFFCASAFADDVNVPLVMTQPSSAP